MSETAEDPFAWVGATVDGKYQVDAVVGHGGFGVVYRAHHRGFDEKVAVKCLKVPPTLSATERQRFHESFVAEGRLLHQLSRATAGIVQALDVGTAVSPNGTWTPFIVLEWLEGQSLHQHFAERRARGVGGRSLREAVELLDSAARALGVAHEQGIAHRDIKPQNLFFASLAGRSALKVLDFGIAKVVSESPSFTSATQETTTALHAFTALYGAPEQFSPRFGASGPWTDVFALALVLVEAVVGRPALGSGDAAQLFVASADPERRPTLRAHGVDAGVAVEAVLERALAVDPRARYAAAGPFWDALCAAVVELDGQPLEPQSRGPLASARALSDLTPTRLEVNASFADKSPESLTELNSSAQLAPAPRRGARSPYQLALSGLLLLLVGLVAGFWFLRPNRRVTLTPHGPFLARASAPLPSVTSAPPAAAAAAGAPATAHPASSAGAADLLPGVPLRDVPAGYIESNGAWVNKFAVLARDASTGLVYDDAFERCNNVGKVLCTESEFERACATYPELAASPTWTSSTEAGGVVVRGGGSCALRKLVSSLERDPNRIGLCCDRAIAMTTKNLQKAFLSSTETAVLKLENALNQRSVEGFIALVDEPVTLGGAPRDRAAVAALLARSFQSSSDLVLVNDICEISVEAKKTVKRTRRTKKTVYETTGWSARCRQTRKRDHKPASAVSTYRFSAMSRLLGIDESEASAPSD